MERWLSKSRVLMALCGVLLIAAFNRNDPMVYGMFLFLATLSVLGYFLPWLSLRSMTVRVNARGVFETEEGAACDLGLVIERRARWPAFLVTIETEWVWASHHMTLSKTLPVVGMGQISDLESLVKMPCRGHYELVSVSLSSGFPLGLMLARRTLVRPGFSMRVQPQAQRVQLPLRRDIVHDPRGELNTRRIGQSFELGMLRAYQYGDPVGRVSWHASARTGDLVIQHFQESGSLRLRVAVELPTGPDLGNPNGAGEQAIRLAVGVCDAALEARTQLYLYCSPEKQACDDRWVARRALTMAQHTRGGLLSTLSRIRGDALPGDQVVVVVSANISPSPLLLALQKLPCRGPGVIVCIALGRRSDSSEVQRSLVLRQALAQSGFATLMEAP